MVFLVVLICIVAVSVYVALSIICGRICVDLIREKNSTQSEVNWFWVGFAFQLIGILMTLVVRDKTRQ